MKRPAILTRENILNWKKRFDAWYKSMPKTWQKETLDDRIRGKSHAVIIKEFQESLTDADFHTASVGVTIIQRVLKDQPFKTLLQEDRRRTRSIIENVIAKHKAQLSQPLAPQLKVGWTRQALIAEANRAKRANRNFRTVISVLRAALSRR